MQFFTVAIPFLALTAGPDFDQVCREARNALDELISKDTSNPPGNEIIAARAAAQRFQAAGLSPEVVESSSGRGSVVVRLKGDGSKRPLLYLAHLDVVGAGPRELWSTDPFKMTEKDGYLYGRGVVDDKAMGAIGIAVASDLKRRGLRLSRDLIVALTADEEAGGDAGIQWLLKYRPNLLDAEIAINEGGGARLEGNKLQFVGIQPDETSFHTFFLETEGPGGHSSVPLPDNAIYRLSAALDRVGRFHFPARLTDTTRAYFSGLARYETADNAKHIQELLSAKGELPQKPVEALAQSPTVNALLRTTCVATRVEGGHADNALPQTAKATVNCRVLSGEPSVIDALKRAIADPKVRIREDRAIGESAPTKLEGPVLEAARKVTATMSPGVPLLPQLSTGATDSRHLRTAGIPSFGIRPFPANDDDARRQHGRDERLLASSFRYGCEFLYRTVEELTAKK